MSSAFQIRVDLPLYEEVEGRWFALAKNGNKSELETFPTAFFPLLEISIKKLMEAHPNAKNFPFVILLVHAAASTSSYWQKLALDRIEEMSLMEECVSVLNDLARAGLSQGIRHKAKRLLKLSDFN